MTKRKALDESNKTDDVCKALERLGPTGSHQSGSHITYQFPQVSITVPVGHGHGQKELSPGVYKQILKMAALAGLLALLLALLLWGTL